MEIGISTKPTENNSIFIIRLYVCICSYDCVWDTTITCSIVVVFEFVLPTFLQTLPASLSPDLNTIISSTYGRESKLLPTTKTYIKSIVFTFHKPENGYAEQWFQQTTFCQLDGVVLHLPPTLYFLWLFIPFATI